MKFNDVKLLLPASGYMKTTQVNGRTVIDEMRDASYERNHQSFVGDDRPELHKTLDGFHQVCVEKETENLIPTANLKFESWEEVGGATVTLTQSQTIEGLTDDATRIQIDGGTSIVKYRTVIEESDYDGPGIIRLYVKNIGNEMVRLTSVRFGTDSATEFNNIDSGEEGWFTVGGGSSSVTGGVKQIAFYAFTSDGSTDIDIIAYQPQAEKSQYPTLFTEGTRLAPSPVIENALPETGTVAGVVDTIDKFEFLTLFDNVFLGANSNIQRTQLQLMRQHSSGQGRLILFGLDGGSITFTHGFGDGNLERLKLAWAFTYNDNQVEVWIMNGNVVKVFSSSYVKNDSSIKDIAFEASVRGSWRMEKPLYKDNIVRVNATDEEIKAFFETLVKGTSMEMKAQDMVII